MSMFIKCRFFILCTTVAMIMGTVTAARKRYDNYQVIRVVPETDNELEAMKQLQERFPYEYQIDFWIEPTRLNSPIDVMVPPNLQNEVNMYLRKHGISVRTLQTNVQKTIDAQMKEGHSSQASDRESTATPSRFDYSVYHTWEEINSWMDSIVAKYPKISEIFTVTVSYEGRIARGIKIRKPSSITKKAVFFTGGIHSREWISPASMIFFIKELVENYDKDRTVTKMVNSLDWYIVPVLNPDGFIYSWEMDRLWRKSREPNEGSVCIGTDLNRNWAFHWGDVNGGSADPCSLGYFGSSPNSSSEITGIQTVLSNIAESQGIALYIDWHSYYQLWLSPWGYTHEYPADYHDHDVFMQVVTSKLTSVYGTQYVYGPIANVIYVATGTSADWVHGVLGVKHSYGVELRDTPFKSPFYGFFLPEKQIIPTALEAWEAVKAGVFHLLEHGV
ncbi:carboxypeptidase B-like [Glandiceps talaboti]